MSAVFDTHKAVKALKEAGFDDTQAEAVVTTVGDAMTGNVATKTDLAEVFTALEADIAAVKADIELLRADMNARLESLEQRITIRLGGMMVVAIGVVAALVKLL